MNWKWRVQSGSGGETRARIFLFHLKLNPFKTDQGQPKGENGSGTPPLSWPDAMGSDCRPGQKDSAGSRRDRWQTQLTTCLRTRELLESFLWHQ